MGPKELEAIGEKIVGSEDADIPGLLAENYPALLMYILKNSDKRYMPYCESYKEGEYQNYFIYVYGYFYPWIASQRG